MRRALGRAMNAVSDAEKNPERPRHTTNSAKRHESPASITEATSKGHEKLPKAISDLFRMIASGVN
jgi:hypothetical protein